MYERPHEHSVQMVGHEPTYRLADRSCPPVRLPPPEPADASLTADGEEPSEGEADE